MTQLDTELISDEAICITAPATPGLIKIQHSETESLDQCG